MALLRRKPPTTEPVSQIEAQTTLTASSARISVRGRAGRSRKVGPQEYMEEAWAHYEACGELQFVVKLIARAMSRARIFITKVDENGVPMQTPPANGPDGRPLPVPFGGPAIQKELLYDVGIQLGVPGDCYLIGEEEIDELTNKVTGHEVWQIVSVDELSETNGEWVLDKGAGKRQLDPQTTVIVEVFDPSPRKHDLPTSQVKSNFRPLRTLERAAKYVNALLNSRLAGPGILAIPNELTFATTEGEMDPADGASSFFARLTDAMMDAIEDPDSPEALVPIVIKGPADKLKEIRWIRMDQELSEVILKIESEALRRLGMGLDVPPEMMEGLAQTNHWTAWELDRSTITYQVEPKLELFCGAVTREFLWPSISSIEGYRDWIVWYDTSELTQPVDKTADAKDVYDRGELGGSALRRESGFSDEDAPTDSERTVRLLLDLAKSIPGVGPQLAPAILAAAGLGIQVQPQVIEAQPGQLPAGDTQPAGGGADPDRKEPPQPAEEGSGEAALSGDFIGACEALVLRALETAGKRLVGRDRYKHRELSPWEYHTVVPSVGRTLSELLQGGFMTVPLVAFSLGVDGEALTATLARYVGRLISAGQAHTRDALAAHLRQEVTGRA